MRGVNLGGWLVLEKWITPGLFKDIDAVDEYTFCQSGRRALTRLKKHHASFITEEDFRWLAEHGVEAVRLPVGYWVFGDEPPFVGALEYVDKAFDWAAQHKLTILLDLHAAPGSQNGNDHSGRAGRIGWDKDPANVTRTLEVIERLAERYGKRPQLLGIELLNEPSPSLKRRVLKAYYERAYRIVRNHCPADAWIVIHDNFRPRRWNRAFRPPQYENVYIDTHRYQCFSKRDKRHPAAWHVGWAAGALARSLRSQSTHHPVIVGEWSLALDAHSIGNSTAGQRDALNRAFGAAQLYTYDQTAGWFFWTYRTERSPEWSYRDAVENSWLPSWK